jgi:hypothetical protein
MATPVVRAEFFWHNFAPNALLVNTYRKSMLGVVIQKDHWQIFL